MERDQAPVLCAVQIHAVANATAGQCSTPQEALIGRQRTAMRAHLPKEIR